MAVVKINAIEVPEGAGPELEKRFAHRLHAVDGQPGFLSFELLRPVAGESRYFVVTHWEDEESFQAWLKGPAMTAHSGERARPVASGSSLLEFEVVQRSEAAVLNDPYDLERFVSAQASIIDTAMAELRAGAKRGHWIWYVFPQLKGLGMSPTSMYYGIGSLAEAQAYLAHPVLGPRLKECVRLLLDAPGSAADILGGDDVKLRSSLTLFVAADPDEPLFAAALERFFDGMLDPRTLDAG